MSNTALVTTGLDPMTVGSVITFELSARINGLPWDLTGGTITLKLQDPSGNQTTLAATGFLGGATANAWTVVTPTGNWTLAWFVTDAAGVHEVSNPVVFAVGAAP